MDLRALAVLLFCLGCSNPHLQQPETTRSPAPGLPVGAATPSASPPEGPASPSSMGEPPAIADTDIVSLAAASTSSCLVYGSGKVACWGQVPPWSEKPVEAKEPRLIEDLSDATQLTYDVDRDRILVLRRDHSVVDLSRGPRHVIANDIRTLGDWGTAIGIDGSIYSPPGAPALTTISDATAIAAGFCGVCVLRATGKALCRGWIGNVDPIVSEPNPEFREIQGIEDAILLAVGREQACVAHRSRRVSCWGTGYEGNLGRKLQSGSYGPMPVAGIEDVVHLTSSGQGWSTCTVHRDGTVSCWGSGDIPADRIDKELGDALQRGPVRLTRPQNAQRVFLGPDTCSYGGPVFLCSLDFGNKGEWAPIHAE